MLSVLTRLRFLFSGVRSLCGAGTPPPPPSAAPGGGDASGCVPRLQGCSGHGRCDAADNSTCICEATWLGESCEMPLVPSSATALDGSSAAGSAPAGGWQCYAYSVRTEGHFRHLSIEMNASAGDPDLYVKHGSYPTLFDYGFRDYTNNAVNVLTIDKEEVGGSDAFLGDWYLCVHGFGASDAVFGLRVLASACPAVIEPHSASACGEQASPKRGSCDAHTGTCTCKGEFRTEGRSDCATRTTWIKPHAHAQEEGHAKKAAADSLNGRDWAFYKFNVTAADYHVQIDMVRTSTGGDPDLYLRYGQAPTLETFDLKDSNYVASHNISLIADDTSSHGGTYTPTNASVWREGVWYVGVYAYGAFATSFDLYLNEWACLNGCSGHGTCDAETHVCACEKGWQVRGDCSASDRALDVDGGEPEHLTVQPMTHQFFDLDVSEAAAKHHVEVRIEAAFDSDEPPNPFFGNLYQYVTLALKRGGYPDVEQGVFDYVVRLQEQMTGYDIHVPASMVTAGTWGAAVYNPLSQAARVNVSASLLAFCPDDCFQELGQGVCGPDGMCVCHAGFVGANCVPTVECMQGMYRPEDLYDTSSGAVIGECYRGCNPATSKFYVGGKCERITCEEPYEPDAHMTGCAESSCRSDVTEPTHDGHGTCTRKCVCPAQGPCRLSDTCSTLKCDKGFIPDHDNGACDPPRCEEGSSSVVADSGKVKGGACVARCVCTTNTLCDYDLDKCAPQCKPGQYADKAEGEDHAWECLSVPSSPGGGHEGSGGGGGMGGGTVFFLCVLMAGLGVGGTLGTQWYLRRRRGGRGYAAGYELGGLDGDPLEF